MIYPPSSPTPQEETKLTEETELDLLDYVRIIKKHFKDIVIITLVALGIGVTATILWPKTYETTGVLRIGQFGSTPLMDTAEVVAVLQHPTAQSEILSLLKERSSGWRSVKKLRKNSIALKSTGTLIVITGRWQDPAMSKMLVDMTAEYTIKNHRIIYENKLTNIDEQIKIVQDKITINEQNLKDNQKQLEVLNAEIRKLSPNNEANARALQAYFSSRDTARARVENYETQLESLKEALANMTLTKQESLPTSVTLAPILPQEPTSYSLIGNGVLAVIVGGILGLFWAFIKESVRRKQKIA